MSRTEPRISTASSFWWRLNNKLEHNLTAVLFHTEFSFGASGRGRLTDMEASA